MKRTATIALLALTLTLTACSGDPAEAEAAPTPTVTVTAEPVIEEVTAEVTPQSCLDALDTAAEAMMVMAKIQDLVKPALEAAADWDATTLDRLSGEIKGHNGELDAIAPGLSVSVSDCRGSAK